MWVVRSRDVHLQLFFLIILIISVPNGFLIHAQMFIVFAWFNGL